MPIRTRQFRVMMTAQTMRTSFSLWRLLKTPIDRGEKGEEGGKEGEKEGGREKLGSDCQYHLYEPSRSTPGSMTDVFEELFPKRCS